MEMAGLIAKGKAVRSGKKRITVPTWQEIQILVLITSLCCGTGAPAVQFG